MEEKSETQLSPDPSSKYSLSFAFKFEGGTYPSSAAVVPPVNSHVPIFVRHVSSSHRICPNPSHVPDVCPPTLTQTNDAICRHRPKLE